MLKFAIVIGLLCSSTQMALAQLDPTEIVEATDTAAALASTIYETRVAVDKVSELEAACSFFRAAETDEEMLLKLLDGSNPISPLQRADCCRHTMLRVASHVLQSDLVWSASGMPVYDAKLAPHLGTAVEIAEAGIQQQIDTLGEKVGAQLDSFEDGMGNSCVPVVARYRAIGSALLNPG